MLITNTNTAIESSSAKRNLCRFTHVSSTVSDRTLDEDLKRALDEDLKRALEKSCNIESPANKKQKMKKSWTFCEPAKVIICPPPSTIEFSTAISCLGNLIEDNRQAKIANMLQEATDMAEAVGKLDPEPKSRPNGRHRFQRRNSFVIRRNRNSSWTFPAPAPSTVHRPPPRLLYRAPLRLRIHNEMRDEEDCALGPI